MVLKGIPLLLHDIVRSLPYQFALLYSREHFLGCSLLGMNALFLRGN